MAIAAPNPHHHYWPHMKDGKPWFHADRACTKTDCVAWCTCALCTKARP